MEWIAQNWVWIVVAVAFVGLHLFGHGGHGGHGSHGGDRGGGGAQDRDSEPAQKPAPRKASDHRHHH